MSVADAISLGGAALGGGGLGAGVRPFLDYLKAKRGQTDEVAMGLVGRLQARIENLEAYSSRERELCDAKLELLRGELKVVQSDFDGLLLAIEVAPEKAAEVVAKVQQRRKRAGASADAA